LLLCGNTELNIIHNTDSNKGCGWKKLF